MNLHTAFSNAKTDPIDEIAIRLQGVSVRYRVGQERIPSFKEYAIRWIQGQIKYSELWALRDIDLEIRRGEVFGIIGPNGAGKSTLLKVVSRVLRPTEGNLQVRGRVSPLLELGAGFDPELTGRENVYLNGAILGHARQEIDSLFDSIVEFSGLSQFIDAPVRTYSSGMYARLGFSIATMKRPEVLIVDEILGVGDAEFQTKSFERIQEFQGAGTTILLVSHGLAQVKEMCSRVVWLDHGKIVAIGTPENVVELYLQRTNEVESERLRQVSEEAGEAPQRWGSQIIQITKVTLCGADGRDQTIFQTGDQLTLHMDYFAPVQTLFPTFGLSIHRQDGTLITGPNTQLANLELPVVQGRGRISYTIAELPLLDGLYQFSVAAVNQSDTEIYDYHDRLYPFRVVNHTGSGKERYGLITLRGKWQHQP